MRMTFAGSLFMPFNILRWKEVTMQWPQPVSNRNLVMTLARNKGKHIPAITRTVIYTKAHPGEQSIEVLKSATVSAD